MPAPGRRFQQARHSDAAGSDTQGNPPSVFSSRLLPLRLLSADALSSAMQLIRLYCRASSTSMRVFSAARASLDACFKGNKHTQGQHTRNDKHPTWEKPIWANVSKGLTHTSDTAKPEARAAAHNKGGRHIASTCDPGAHTCECRHYATAEHQRLRCAGPNPTPYTRPDPHTFVSFSSHSCRCRLTSVASTRPPNSMLAVMTVASMGLRQLGVQPWEGATSSVHWLLGTSTLAVTGSTSRVGLAAMTMGSLVSG